jgi:hypothetical protein
MSSELQMGLFIGAMLVVVVGGLALLIFVISPMEKRRAQAKADMASTRGDAVASLAADEAVRAHKLTSQLNGATMWLAMIGGFTLFNAVEWLTHQNTRMVIGLIATRLLTFQIVDAGDVGRTIELLAAVSAAFVFCALALLVYKRQMWALVAGTVLYAADFVLFLAVVGTRDVMGLVFHALAVGALLGAYLAASKLKPSPIAAPSLEAALPAEAASLDR